MFFVKGSFLIKAKEDNVITEKGIRAFIMEKLLNTPLARGTIKNIDKKTIQVRLEGDEKQVREFIKELEQELREQIGNPAISFSQFLEDTSLEIPSLLRSSQSLMVGQLQKGISVQLQILETLKGNENNFKSLPKQISEEISKTLPKQLSEEMSKKLPKQIATELSKVMTQQTAGTAKEI